MSEEILHGFACEFVHEGDTCKLVDFLVAENAKLRELASGLHRCMEWEGCEGCPMQDDDSWCVRDVRLRELGVEVD